MKQELFDKLVDCEQMGDVTEIIDTLTSGEDYRFHDSKIDDGCDDDEADEYVMKDSYSFCVDDEWIDVDFYYGNNTFKIGWIKY